MARNDTSTVGSPALAALRADLARYREDPWLDRMWWFTERSVCAVVAFRLGQRVLEIEDRRLRTMLAVPYGLALTAVQAWTGVEIMPNTAIGPGLRIHHGTGLVINAGSVIGARVVLRQGVTIGARQAGGTEFPRVGDDVEFGAYAQVFGGVTVGDGARVGSMSVVLHDVPSRATVAGAPAKVVSSREPSVATVP